MTDIRKKSNNKQDDTFNGKKKSGKVSRNAILVRWMWIMFLGLGTVIALFLLLIYNGVIGYMPPIE